MLQIYLYDFAIQYDKCFLKICEYCMYLIAVFYELCKKILVI